MRSQPKHLLSRGITMNYALRELEKGNEKPMKGEMESGRHSHLYGTPGKVYNIRGILAEGIAARELENVQKSAGSETGRH